MVVCMALAVMGMAAPLGHTQEVTPAKTICANCGVAAPIAKCPPGVTKPSCPDVKDYVRPNWRLDFSPSTQEATTPATKCAKCGVATPIGKCAPGAKTSSCPDVKDSVRPTRTVDVSPNEDPYTAFGFSPAWSDAGVSLDSKNTVCPKCGVGFPIDSRLKRLENQP